MADVPDPTFIEGLASWELEHVSAVNTLEKKADAPEAEASILRWKQAEAIDAACSAGMSQRRLADNWHRPDGTTYSEKHVRLVRRTLQVYADLSPHERPRWNDAYNSDEVRGKKQAHVSHNSGENEWFSSPELVEAARQVMGGIALDPASTATANAVIGADTFYTKEDNGLLQPWFGPVWMNPPYAQPLIEQFCEKLADEYTHDNVAEACALVNNATETAWFQRLASVGNAISYPKGRGWFWHDERKSAPLQGQAVVYLGSSVAQFRSIFRQFGFTVAL